MKSEYRPPSKLSHIRGDTMSTRRSEQGYDPYNSHGRLVQRAIEHALDLFRFERVVKIRTKLSEVEAQALAADGYIISVDTVPPSERVQRCGPRVTFTYLDPLGTGPATQE